MAENSKVSRRRTLFTLAGKITRYANHWLYMKICLSLNVIPKGLKLKKNPQIGEKSTQFIQEWNRIMSNAEMNLLETLANEYYVVTSTLPIKFWHKVTEFLQTGPNVIEAKQIFSELCKKIEKDQRNIAARREKKLSKLIQGKSFSSITELPIAKITFFEDIKSFLISNVDENVEENHTSYQNTRDVNRSGRESDLNDFGNQQLEEEGRLIARGENNAVFEVRRDENGRLEGRFENDKVVNLSQRALSHSEISVLSKGLKFVATPKEIDFSQVKIDLENFGRRLRLKWHFREEEGFPDAPSFRPKSKFNPRHKDEAIEVFLSRLEGEIMKISANGCNFSNLDTDERAALRNLKAHRSIVIKEADRGSGVVVWDKEDYILEAINQLGDSNVYLKLDSNPSEHLQKVIDDAISIIRERGDMDEKTLEYFLVNDPKLVS